MPRRRLQQFQCAVDFARGELAKCLATRPGDAAGLYRQLAHFIATFAADVHRSHPAPEFGDSFPALPGGGWAPKSHSDARLP